MTGVSIQSSAVRKLHVGIVGPLPPPAGGMATQTLQLVNLLGEDNIDVSLVQSNKPYQPKWIENAKGIRALFRLIPYLFKLWTLAGRVDVIHLMANSGWSWQLFSAPVIWIGWFRNTPVIVNYRGGEAKSYFEKSFKWVRPTLNKASLIVVPSGYLKKVFADVGIDACVIPNIVNLERFKPAETAPPKLIFKLIITRNLEAIYGIDMAIKAVAIARQKVPNISLEIAGTGPQKNTLMALTESLKLTQQVKFVGRLDADQIVGFYQAANIMLNPTTVDNMPNSVLEALACGVPVITTDVGGIPFVVENGKTAMLVPAGDDVAMARQIVSLYQNDSIRDSLISNGLAAVQPYAWPRVKDLWINLYSKCKSEQMSRYTRFVSSTIFPLHEKLKKHSTVRVREEMEQNQWLSASALGVVQRDNLKSFLVDIGQSVPYYRELFQSLQFDPEQLVSIEQLQQLPLTGKPEIRANQERLKADDAVGLSRFNTGGSSGEPLIFYIGSKRVSHDVAAKWRATRWWGVDIGDPEIVVWGSPIELGAQDRVRQIRDTVFRTQLLSAFEMSENKLDEFIATIYQVKPRMLFGYPSALAHIAGHAEKRGVDLSDIGIRVAFVTSERLYDHQREAIERVFGCPVANGYGGRDAGFIAHQCSEGSLHITTEDIIVEIIGSGGEVLPKGELGEITVTHLATRDFPFVRYRTGDMGVLSDELCNCGRGLPILKEVQGRSTDFLTAKDGTILHGLALVYILRDLPGITSFKITQESLDLICVDIVRDDSYEIANEVAITDVFHQRLGRDVDIKINYCDEIKAEKSGKFRYVVSKVA